MSMELLALYKEKCVHKLLREQGLTLFLTLKTFYMTPPTLLRTATNYGVWKSTIND